MFDSDCKRCKKEVTASKISRSVACERCSDWYHAACLPRIKEMPRRVIEARNIFFICDPCIDPAREELNAGLEKERKQRIRKYRNRGEAADDSTIVEDEKDIGAVGGSCKRRIWVT